MDEIGIRGALPAVSLEFYREDMASLVRNTGLAAEATEPSQISIRSSMRHDGEYLQQSQLKLLIDETALAGRADWQLVDHFDRNVEHAAHTLANGTQCSF
jgi:hypothetical protein